MAKISTYPILSTPTLNDLLIGTDVENLNITKNFSIGDIASFIVGGSYVPYVGATGNVNLGAFNITASSFIVGGGLATQFLKANGTLDSTVYQPAGNYITQLSGEATASGPGNASVTLSNSAVINKVLTGLTITGSVIVATDSILTAFGKVQNQINTLVGGVQYQGTWNAATNTPTLTSSVGVQGHYYVVSVPGSTNLNGITDWKLGDWAIYNGTAWDKIDNTDAVISVNGEVGAVVLTTTNISEGTNLYFTNSRARTAINLTTTGNSGAATYNNTNGFFNIPEYTLSGLGGVPLTRQLTINGTAFDLSANRSWNVGTVTSVGTNAPLTGGTITGSGTIGITQAGASSDGYLSSTDWTTFNSKQNVITNPVTGTGTAFFLPMWASASSLINSPLSYASDAFTFGYNSATGGTVNFTNSGLTPYTYSIQMNNFGSPRSTIHSYTDGVVVQSIGGTQVSRIFANGNTVLGIGIVDNGNKLEIEGSLKVNTIDNATTDTDRFLVSDLGVIKYRTGTELRSDIGAGVGSVTSVGLTMPSAFSVANSPVTGSGTLAVTGAGSASQYVRGDGTLADFPTTTGGGSSVSYYLNGSVSQGTIGGVAYRELSEIPIFGAGTDISIAADGYIASFITDAGDPSLLNIPAGNWNFETYFSASSGGGTPTFYVELYRYDGTTFTLIASSSGTPELISFGTNIQPYFSTLAVPQTALALTDRLAIRYYVATSGRTITLHTEDNHLCQVITTFSNGLTALNGLTEQVQYFQVGTSGTDFNIVSSVATHTFNLPDASTSNRGVVTTGTQTFAGYKIFNGTIGANVDIQLATQGTALNTFIKNINATGQTSIGSNGFGFNNANNIYFSGSSKGGGIIAFNNTGNQTYTLQNASGTLAFTSDLGGYLPLTGGTLTGALNGTSAAFSDSITATRTGSGASITAINTGSNAQIQFSNSTHQAQIGIANLGSGAAANTFYINTSAGTIGSGITMNNSGDVTLAGALNGTSGTFSGGLVSNGGAIGYGGGELGFGVTTSGASSAIYTLATGSPVIFFDHRATGNTGSFVFRNGSGGANTLLTLASTGAATFSSSVTAAGNIFTQNDSVFSTAGSITRHSVVGLVSRGVTASVFDWSVYSAGGTALIQNPTGTNNIGFSGGQVSFTGGNVGIGTASPVAKFEIASAANTYTGAPAITLTDTSGDANSNRWIVGNIATDYGSFNIASAPSPTSTTFTPRLTINRSGNVGIGTASPKTITNGLSLTIGDGGTQTQPYLGLARNATGGFFAGINFYDGNTIKSYIQEDADFNLRIGTSNTERLRITSSGNVGIGTASPAYALDVNGSTNVSSTNFYRYNGDTGIIGSGSAITGGSSTQLGIRAASDILFATNGATERMRITSSGNVGIGTASPEATLDVAGNIRVGNQLDSTSRYVGKIGSGGSIRNAVGFISSSTEDYVMINTHLSGQRSGESMRITGAGNVGIGTASPSERLSVLTSTNYAATFNSSVGDLTTTRISLGGFSSGGAGGQGGTAAIGCEHHHFATTASSLTFYTYGGGSLSERMRITSVGDTQPGADNAYSLGVSGTRWSAVWAANGTIQTSDEREKKDIIESDLGLGFITKLRPVSFKWKVGQNVVTSQVVKDEEGNPILDEEGNEKTESVLIPREGKRTHYGLIAQEVEEVLDGKDFGGFIHDEETDTKGLRYDQFVPLLIKSIQELNDKIAILESKLK